MNASLIKKKFAPDVEKYSERTLNLFCLLA